MAIYNILKEGDPALREKSKLVQNYTQHYQTN